MEKHRHKKPRKPRIKKPFGPLYYFAAVAVECYYRLAYGINIERQATRKIKGPILVLANHQCFLDFMLVAITMLPRRLNFMVSSFYYKTPFMRGLLGVLQTIPKDQFSPDISSIKKSIDCIRGGNALAIFPEGQVTFYGSTTDIDPSIAKLIKKLGATVVGVSIRGHFLCNPKHAQGTGADRHFGKLEVVTDILATSDEIREMSETEIYQRVVKGLSQDDYEWQRQRQVRFRPRRWSCLGLDKVIYYCPSCHEYFTIKSTKEKVYCENCGYTTTLDRYGFFQCPDGSQPVYDTLSNWYQAQRTCLKKDLEQNRVLPVQCSCHLMTTKKGNYGYMDAGKGRMVLDDEGILYEGTRFDENISWRIRYAHSPRLTHNSPTHSIDIPYDRELLSVIPENKRMMIYIIESYNLARQRWEEQREKKLDQA